MLSRLPFFSLKFRYRSLFIRLRCFCVEFSYHFSFALVIVAMNCYKTQPVLLCSSNLIKAIIMLMCIEFTLVSCVYTTTREQKKRNNFSIQTGNRMKQLYDDDDDDDGCYQWHSMAATYVYSLSEKY